jgi:hypothetical protein
MAILASSPLLDRLWPSYAVHVGGLLLRLAPLDASAESDRSMYSIYDERLGRLMSTGRNCPTKEAAKEDLLHYLSGSFTRDLAARHHYKIFKHLTPYPTDKQYSSL